MYGKIFSSMYEGSMVGIGAHVLALWGYCIAKADGDDHMVEINPVLLACIIGEPVERIKEALQILLTADPDSHSQEASGARLTHVIGHRYHVTTHEHYREISGHSDMRAYMRDAKRKQRAKSLGKQGELDLVKDSQRQSKTPDSDSDSVSEEERESEGGKKAPKQKPVFLGEFKNVKLSNEEYEKLLKIHGQTKLAEGIDILGDYMKSKGKTYKCHYAVLKKTSWVWTRVAEKPSTTPGANRNRLDLP